MALLFFDGFDAYATADILKRWTTGSGTISAGKLGAPVSLGKYVVATGNTAIIGFAIDWPSFVANQTIVGVANTSFVTFRTLLVGNADGTLSARVSGIGGTLLGTTAWTAVTSTRYFLEVKMVFDTVVGSVQIWIDGNSILQVTDVDTTNGGGTTWGTFTLNNLANYNDFYVCDTSGDYNNDRLGDVVAEALFPLTDASDPGLNHALTPSTGTDHGAMVDEVTPNGDTDYNASAAVDIKDTYQFPSVTSTGAVKAIQVLQYARKTDQSIKLMAPTLRSNGTDYDGDTVNVSPVYSYLNEIFETSPDTGLPWNGGAVNSLEAGPHLLTASPASPTKFYVTNVVAPYTPATIRGAWDQTASAVTKALSASKEGGGVNTSIAIAETNATNPWRVLLGRWISGPLAAQTIAGTLNVVLPIQESSSAADMNYGIHLYVTQGDTDTPRGTLLTNYNEALGVNEWPTTATFRALNAAATLSSLAISDGDRLVFESGYYSREASATSRTGTLRYGTLDSGILTTLADGAPAGTDVTAKAGFITFSSGITELNSSTSVRVSQVVVEVLSGNVPAGTDPNGGGDPGDGTDPAAGVSLCGQETTIWWITVQTDSGQKTYAYGDVGIDTVFREARIKSIGDMARALSDRTSRPETPNAEIVLIDTDRVLRGLADTGTLLNKRVDVYVASVAQIKAAATPRRVAMMVIRDFEPGDELTFTIRCEDYYSAFLGEFGTPRQAHGKYFNSADFPFLPNSLQKKPVPTWYGLQSDEARASNSIGVVPGISVGPRRLSDGLDWEEFVIADSALKVIVSWFASDLNPDPRPIKISPITEGTEFLIPGMAGWTAIVSANPYVEYNGNRYFVVFARGQRAIDAKTGVVPMSFNVGGREDVGDGSGDMIDSFPLQIQHFISQDGVQKYSGGNWAAIPSVNGYSRVKTSTFAGCEAISIARIGGDGYLGAVTFGANQEEITMVEALRRAFQDCDAQFGINRHGQVIASMVDGTASAVKTFVDVTDIKAHSFHTRRRFEQLANRIQLRSQKNYIFDARPNSARTSIEWWSDFWSETVDIENAASITALGEPEPRLMDLDGFCLRDPATAADVAAQLLIRLKNGPEYVTFTTDLCGLDVELGDNINITHYAGTSATGWTEKLVRVERIVVHPDDDLVTLEGTVIPDDLIFSGG